MIHADQRLQEEEPHRGPEHQGHDDERQQAAPRRKPADDPAIGVLPLKGRRQIFQFVQPSIGQVGQCIHDREHRQRLGAIRAARHEQVDDRPAHGLYAARHGQGPEEAQHICRR